ncbi:MAG: RNA 2',3'-cyclic phosphodiesterase [Proteobacteria bacterium]|nr:RNA 2',3'-cyclic phosphodiesterase [Pseudomonadota bacterium]
MSEIVVPAYVGPKPKKLFIGIRVSVPTANALGMAVETLARRATEAKLDVRWVPPANYHVTLRYLGYTRPEILPALRDKLALAVRDVAPFGFRTSRLGGFPSIDQAQVLWAGIEDAGQRALAALAAKIEAAVVELGFASEPRPFHGHVTIARPREIASLTQVVLPLSEQMFSETKTDGITIIESEMK